MSSVCGKVSVGASVHDHIKCACFDEKFTAEDVHYHCRGSKSLKVIKRELYSLKTSGVVDVSLFSSAKPLWWLVRSGGSSVQPDEKEDPISWAFAMAGGVIRLALARLLNTTNTTTDLERDVIKALYFINSRMCSVEVIEFVKDVWNRCDVPDAEIEEMVKTTLVGMKPSKK